MYIVYPTIGIGSRFGRLEVVGRAANDKHGKAQWECKCDCGALKIASQNALNRGRCSSCGCLSKEMTVERSKRLFTKPNNQSALHSIELDYRINASRRGIDFNLSAAEVECLVRGDCHYCGAMPSNKRKGFAHSGIDRKDNAKPYDYDNCVSCCWPCNSTKKRKGYDDFIEQRGKENGEEGTKAKGKASGKGKAKAKDETSASAEAKERVRDIPRQDGRVGGEVQGGDAPRG